MMLRNCIQHQWRSFSTKTTNPLFAARSNKQKPIESEKSEMNATKKTTESKPKKESIKKTTKKPIGMDSNQSKKTIGQNKKQNQPTSFEKAQTSLYLDKQSFGTVWIPHELRVVLSKTLKGVPRQDLRRQSTVLSEILRARTTTKGSRLFNTDIFANQKQKPTIEKKKEEEGIILLLLLLFFRDLLFLRFYFCLKEI